MYWALSLHTDGVDQISTDSMVHYSLNLTNAACILVLSAALMLPSTCSSLCASGAASWQDAWLVKPAGPLNG